MRNQFDPAAIHPIFETLDTRCLLSSVVLNGVLTLFGGSLDDTFSVTLISNGATIKVAENGFAASHFPAANVTAIDAELAGGSNTLTIAAAITKPTTVSAGSGADSITTGGGNDSITAGSGEDTINGSAGNDTIDAGDGNDSISGGSGNDSISGGSGKDTINAGDGNDTVHGGNGNDSIHG